MSKVRIIYVMGVAILLVVASMQLLLTAVSMDVGSSRAYFSDTETTSATIQAGVWDVPPASPSLSLDPDDAETEISGNQVYPVIHVINVSNTGDEPKDLARDVTLNVSIVKGEQYVAVDGLFYNPVIGDIPAGEAREFSLGIYLNDLWGEAKDGEEVKLRIEVTGEYNWPEHNIGRRAHFTII